MSAPFESFPSILRIQKEYKRFTGALGLALVWPLAYSALDAETEFTAVALARGYVLRPSMRPVRKLLRRRMSPWVLAASPRGTAESRASLNGRCIQGSTRGRSHTADVSTGPDRERM